MDIRVPIHPGEHLAEIIQELDISHIALPSRLECRPEGSTRLCMVGARLLPIPLCVSARRWT